MITEGARAALPEQDVIATLERHAAGDWGELDEHDWKFNDEALEDGNRVLSRYSTPDGIVFWIITEHDRSLTTVLLPEEY